MSGISQAVLSSEFGPKYDKLVGVISNFKDNNYTNILNDLSNELTYINDDVKNAFINQANVMLSQDSATKNEVEIKTELSNSEDWKQITNSLTNIPSLHKDVKPVITELADKIVTMHARNKYLQYRYMSSNVFILRFIHHIIELLKEFVINIEVKSEQTGDVNIELINQIMQLINKNPQGDVTDINDMLQKLIEQLQQWKNGIQESKHEFADKIMSMLNEIGKPGHETEQVQGQRQQGQQGQRQPGQGGATKKNTRKPRQKGGFVRDGSRFPPEFYEAS